MSNHLRLSRIRRAYRMPLLVAGLAVAVASGAVLASSNPGVTSAHATKPQSQYAALTDDHLKELIHHVMALVDESQKAQIIELAHRAKPEFERFEARAREARAPRKHVLLADVIDRPALERIREAEMGVAQERSRRVDQLLVELVSVMTPQQRARFLAELQAPAH